MRIVFTRILGISAIFAAVSAQLVIPQLVFDQAKQSLEHQGVMDGATDSDFKRAPVLSDQLALEPQASIFFSYARESAKLSGVLSGVVEGKYTVFVPTNKAVMALASKPHQGSGSNVDDSIEITDEEADQQSLKNVERWVSAHIIPESITLIAASAGDHKTLLDGKSLKLSHEGAHTTPERAHWRVNDGISIIGEREAANGIMYLIDGTIEV